MAFDVGISFCFAKLMAFDVGKFSWKYLKLSWYIYLFISDNWFVDLSCTYWLCFYWLMLSF